MHQQQGKLFQASIRSLAEGETRSLSVCDKGYSMWGWLIQLSRSQWFLYAISSSSSTTVTRWWWQGPSTRSSRQTLNQSQPACHSRKDKVGQISQGYPQLHSVLRLVHGRIEGGGGEESVKVAIVHDYNFMLLLLSKYWYDLFDFLFSLIGKYESLVQRGGRVWMFRFA